MPSTPRYEQARPEDLDAVVGLHLCNLPWTLNSRAGRTQVRGLYESLLADPAASVVVARLDGAIVASAAGTSDYSRTSQRAAQRSRARLLRGVFTTSPFVTVPLMYDAWRTHRLIERIDGPYAFLLTWFTDSAARGQGVGRGVLATLVRQISAPGRPLVVAVSDSAVDGHAAYRALGFVQVARAPRTDILQLDDTSPLTERT